MKNREKQKVEQEVDPKVYSFTPRLAPRTNKNVAMAAAKKTAAKKAAKPKAKKPAAKKPTKKAAPKKK